MRSGDAVTRSTEAVRIGSCSAATRFKVGARTSEQIASCGSFTKLLTDFDSQ
jgi:hypothetical protein